jgi:hypothetical protein
MINATAPADSRRGKRQGYQRLLTILFLASAVGCLLWAQAAARSKWEKEKAHLVAQLAKSVSAPEESHAATAELSASATTEKAGGKGGTEILLDLLSAPSTPSVADKITYMHSIMFQLGALSSLHDDAIPAIEAFLISGSNRIYWGLRTAEPHQIQGSGGEASNPHLAYDYAFPPTLRAGVVEVLGVINSIRSEVLLVKTLYGIRDGSEMYYAYKALERNAPSKYKDVILGLARGLLGKPSDDTDMRAAYQSREYLFFILGEYRDPAVASMGQEWIINESGAINKRAAEYLLNTLKSEAVPTFHRAFKQAGSADLRDRFLLVGLAADYYGPSDPANAFVNEVINDEDLPAIQRTMLIQTLNGYNLFTGKYSSLDDATIGKRIDLINNLRASNAANGQFNWVLEKAAQRLASLPRSAGQ